MEWGRWKAKWCRSMAGASRFFSDSAVDINFSHMDHTHTHSHAPSHHPIIMMIFWVFESSMTNFTGHGHSLCQGGSIFQVYESQFWGVTSAADVQRIDSPGDGRSHGDPVTSWIAPRGQPKWEILALSVFQPKARQGTFRFVWRVRIVSIYTACKMTFWWRTAASGCVPMRAPLCPDGSDNHNHASDMWGAACCTFTICWFGAKSNISGPFPSTTSLFYRSFLATINYKVHFHTIQSLFFSM